MATITITTRTRQNGKSYVVRFRRGGRGYAIEHAGSFKTLKDARLRKEAVAGWLAQGLNPIEQLRVVVNEPAKRTITEWGEAMVTSRLDVSDSRLRFLRTAITNRIEPTFGDKLPEEVTPVDVQEWVAGMAADLAPRTTSKYWQVLSMIFDFAETTPNPAKHKNVRLPYADIEEITPPSTEHFLALVGKLTSRMRLPAVMLEQTAARVSELRAWEWQDVDIEASRIRSRGVKGRRGSRRVVWRQVPPWLMQVVLDTVPPDDRTPERKLFVGLKEGSMRDAIARASRAAKLPLYSPHDLRHRRGSLWHAGGMTARELAERMGHSKASMSLDVYTHSMPPDEVDEGALLALLTA